MASTAACQPSHVWLAPLRTQNVQPALLHFVLVNAAPGSLRATAATIRCRSAAETVWLCFSFFARTIPPPTSTAPTPTPDAGTNVVNAFFYPGTAGVLAMLIAYFVIQLGAAKFLHLEGREPRWRAIIIGLAIAAIVYTFYKQVWPKPPYPYDVFPLLIAGWAAVGIAVVLFFPGLTRKIGKGLSEAEGIVGDG